MLVIPGWSHKFTESERIRASNGDLTGVLALRNVPIDTGRLRGPSLCQSGAWSCRRSGDREEVLGTP